MKLSSMKARYYGVAAVIIVILIAVFSFAYFSKTSPKSNEVEVTEQEVDSSAPLLPNKSQTQTPSENSSGTTSQPLTTITVHFTSQDLLAKNCGATIPVTRQITSTQAVAKAALLELFKGPTAEEKSKGLISNFIGWEAVLDSVTIAQDGTLFINFKKQVLTSSSAQKLSDFNSSCSSGAWQQIYQTMKQFPTVKYVVFEVDGSPQAFANVVFMRGCPVTKSEGETQEQFTQAQKQCAQ
jgi:spore germination protein GerM